LLYCEFLLLNHSQLSCKLLLAAHKFLALYSFVLKLRLKLGKLLGTLLTFGLADTFLELNFSLQLFYLLIFLKTLAF